MKFRLPARYTPKDWMANKFSAELWLQRAMRTHPWRVNTSLEADLVILEANYSMCCRAGKMFSGRSLWQKMNAAIGIPPPVARVKLKTGKAKGPLKNLTFAGAHVALRGAEQVPKAYVLTDNEVTIDCLRLPSQRSSCAPLLLTQLTRHMLPQCMPPWIGSKRQKGLIELTDQSPVGNDVVSLPACPCE